MIYVFDVYVLDPGRRELRRGSDRIEVEPQVFDLLEFLIRTRDRVASRDDILEAVWNGRIVSEFDLEQPHQRGTNDEHEAIAEKSWHATRRSQLGFPLNLQMRISYLIFALEGAAMSHKLHT